MSFTADEKLAEVERLIYERRFAQQGTREYRTAVVLKAIASDIRGRMPGKPGDVARSLDRRINNAKAAKNGAPHYPVNHLVGIGQETIGKWSCIRQALERFEAEIGEATE